MLWQRFSCYYLLNAIKALKKKKKRISNRSCNFPLNTQGTETTRCNETDDCSLTLHFIARINNPNLNGTGTTKTKPRSTKGLRLINSYALYQVLPKYLMYKQAETVLAQYD